MGDNDRGGERRCAKLKMRKAHGICGLVPEMLKAGGEVVIEWLTEVWNGSMWCGMRGMAPSDWRNAVIVPVY